MSDQSTRQSIQRAVEGLAMVEFAASRSHTIAQVLRTRPAAVLLPVTDPRGGSLVPIIERLRIEAPDVALIVMVSDRFPVRPGVARACRRGATLANGDAIGTLHNLLADVLGPRTRSTIDAVQLRQALREAVPEELRRALLGAVVHVHQHWTVGDLAREAGCSERTLRRRLAAARWPSPAILLDWARVFRTVLVSAGRVARDRNVAIAAGFRSSRAMRATMQRLLNRAGEDRRLSLDIVVAAFLRSLSRAG